MIKTVSAKETHTRQRLGTPTDLKPEATRDISGRAGGTAGGCLRPFVDLDAAIPRGISG